ncbi:hypothetical protein DPMN_085850 [Dreissena polymorpha]|uniref:Uncharacterized protein n=1 Tax=Dreissena polymorpha TaxID=45954 RepID=A0A9D4BD75_DREPO|nr:hypothetical protein DPMN_085850 [Dreissena polymorpha]
MAQETFPQGKVFPLDKLFDRRKDVVCLVEKLWTAEMAHNLYFAKMGENKRLKVIYYWLNTTEEDAMKNTNQAHGLSRTVMKVPR